MSLSVGPALSNSATETSATCGFTICAAIHATALLDADIPVHTVVRRIGDPAILLRNYVKR
jgi:hypothetical protein